MKIRPLSDLHLEFTNYEPKSLLGVSEDLVVLAGDIAEGTQGIAWAKEAIPDRPVIYVLGNHEFYGEDWELLVHEARAAAAGSNIHLLENDALDFPGLRVLGCSLWTDFQALGAADADEAMQVADTLLSDFFAIRAESNRRWLRPSDTVARCLESHHWLRQQIETSDRPLLVVTHHAPTMATVHPKYQKNIENTAFHSRFDHLIRPPVRAWIHGHTHHSAQAVVNGIPVISNQRGYPGEDCAFDWDYCMEIPA